MGNITYHAQGLFIIISGPHWTNGGQQHIPKCDCFFHSKYEPTRMLYKLVSHVKCLQLLLSCAFPNRATAMLLGTKHIIVSYFNDANTDLWHML